MPYAHERDNMRLLIVAAILSLFTTTNAAPQPAIVAFGDHEWSP